MIDDTGNQEDFEPSEQLPILKNRPRYLLVDVEGKRRDYFKKHTAEFIRGVLLDIEDPAEMPVPENSKYEAVFISSNFYSIKRDFFKKFTNEIVIIDDFRDHFDWLACAYYGDETGCKRLNSKVEEKVKKRNFWQRLVYLFKGE